MMRYRKTVVILIVLALLLYACAHRKQTDRKTKAVLIQVSSQPQTSTLFYSGSIQPLKTVVISSPSDGTVGNLLFHYGDVVKKDQVLFSISSEKFQTDYRTALTQYIKMKTDFISNQSQLKEAEFLHQHQLISDDDFKAKQTSFYNAQLAMVQSKEALAAILGRLNQQTINLFDLNIEDIDKITKMLAVQDGVQRLQVVAPAEGIILLPTKGESDGELKKLTKGDQVKQGDVLAVVGDLTGLAVHINVSEFNINQLKVGQKVTVTGAAFPDLMLEGKIEGLHRQGQPSQGGMPVFPVEVVVPHLSAKERAIIHMGMSAKVAIELGGDPVILVPIKAVHQVDGKSYVNVVDRHTGKMHEVNVRTGATTLDSVAIESNLSEGDTLVVPG